MPSATPSSHQESRLHQTHGRLSRYQDYLAEFVYGGIDGSVTTFAVVAGAAGARLSAEVVLILGFANLLADGLSMSIGSYLSNQAERDNYAKHQRIEYAEVDQMPEQEREEIRDIYRAKGFEGELLEQVVAVITADRDRWVSVMMKEELEMIPSHKPPINMALVTFVSFVTVGFVPLLVYVSDFITRTQTTQRFWVASLLTFLAFVAIGWLKSTVTQRSVVRGVLETVALGAVAAAVAYFVGDVLESWLA